MLPTKFHLAERFQRRRLKCEKLTDDRRPTTDDGRQVMAKAHNCLWQGKLKKGNNSKMGNGIYFKIAGYVDLDMLNNFAI